VLACHSQNATPMNAVGFPISSNRHLRLGKHVALPSSGIYESRVDVDVWVVVRNPTPGGADINVPRWLMVKFFLKWSHGTIFERKFP
jgi:hypothetical protein